MPAIAHVQRRSLRRERRHEQPVGDDERRDLRRRRHERGHRRRRALVGVGRPHVERRRRGLEREARRSPSRGRARAASRVRGPAAAILSKPSWPVDAVDERRAEEQRRRADRADDQVLEPGLERADEVDVDRAEDVERDREPLEPEEERHQVRRLDEERHAGARGREQRVVLGDVLARASARRRRCSTATRPQPAMRTCATAAQRSRKIASATIGRAVRALVGEHDREHERRDEAERRRRSPRRLARRAVGTKTATSSSRPAAASSASEGESANQSTCGLCDHLCTPPSTSSRRSEQRRTRHAGVARTSGR